MPADIEKENQNKKENTPTDSNEEKEDPYNTDVPDNESDQDINIQDNISDTTATPSVDYKT